MNLGELLVNAGYDVQTTKIEDYTQCSQVEFPFGSLVNNADSDVYFTHVQNSLKGINYIRNSMTSITVEDFKEMFPMSEPNFVYNYLIKNIDRVRVVDRGSVSRETRQLPGYYHMDVTEDTFVNDVPYGFADVIMMFYYSVQTDRVLFTFYSSAINTRYQQNVYEEVSKYVPDAYVNTYTYEDGLKYFPMLRPIIDKCPYLLIYKSKYDGVIVSHKKYKGHHGTIHDEVTSPCLGENILKHKRIIDKLSDWFAEGGKINPNNYYLIHKKRDSEQLYLARWKETTIPNECVLFQF